MKKGSLKTCFLLLLICKMMILEVDGREGMREKLKTMLDDPESVGLKVIEINWPNDYQEEGLIKANEKFDTITFNTEGKLNDLKITVESDIIIQLFLSKKENPSPQNYDFKSESGRVVDLVVYPTGKKN